MLKIRALKGGDESQPPRQKRKAGFFLLAVAASTMFWRARVRLAFGAAAIGFPKHWR